MTVIEFILIGLSMGLPVLMTMKGCAGKVQVRLSWGLVASLLVAAVMGAMLALGVSVGNLLRFGSEGDAEIYGNANNLIYIGLVAVVAVKMFAAAFKDKKKVKEVYDISRFGTVFMLAVAMGINTLLLGLGAGFAIEDDEVAKGMLMGGLIVSGFVLVFAYLGVMMGRQKKKLKERRWSLMAVVFLLSAVIYHIINW